MTHFIQRICIQELCSLFWQVFVSVKIAEKNLKYETSADAADAVGVLEWLRLTYVLYSLSYAVVES